MPSTARRVPQSDLESTYRTTGTTNWAAEVLGYIGASLASGLLVVNIPTPVVEALSNEEIESVKAIYMSLTHCPEAAIMVDFYFPKQVQLGPLSCFVNQLPWIRAEHNMQSSVVAQEGEPVEPATTMSVPDTAFDPAIAAAHADGIAETMVSKDFLDTQGTVRNPVSVTIIKEGINKEVRVRRPLNAFILFRLDMHPMVVAQEPLGTTNNQISRIIGAMWARAPAFLRNYYGAEAEARKIQHALSNPGYRYHPRKSSEVKRRMTKRKAEEASFEASSTAVDESEGTTDSGL